MTLSWSGLPLGVVRCPEVSLDPVEEHPGRNLEAKRNPGGVWRIGLRTDAVPSTYLNPGAAQCLQYTRLYRDPQRCPRCQARRGLRLCQTNLIHMQGFSIQYSPEPKACASQSIFYEDISFLPHMERGTWCSRLPLWKEEEGPSSACLWGLSVAFSELAPPIL